jgi:LPXTG-site transpeptidase (sortase) family protein
LKRTKQLGLALALLPVLLLLLPVGQSMAATIPVSPYWSFLQVWERSDYPVALGATQRSWYWGPAPFATFKETYAESPYSSRMVAYYDKGRMEITQPNSDRFSRWYVTKGLLVKEMVNGYYQLGDNSFQAAEPAQLPVSGDGPATNKISPTYASFQGLTGPASRSFAPVGATLARSGQVSNDSALASNYPETAPAYFDVILGHNIPGVFWRFMNLQGPVSIDHQLVNATVEDWLYNFGLPLTEAYWTRSLVGGVEKDVLVQLFERRLLTYTPSNDPAYRVEMGNVGRHYFDWRYSNAASQPGPAPTFTQPPLRLSVPAIGVDTLIEYVATKADGSMDIPHNPFNVAYYRYGASVGEKGNAVIAGHLDWYNIGAAVFYNLRKLQPGDMVYVYTTLGIRHSFRVTETASYPLNDFPQERIFGSSDSPNLNLITCNGSFDPSSASYNRRLVVYTTLVDE